MKTVLGSAVLVVAVMTSAGCSGLLGLEDKLFEEPTGGGGGTTTTGTAGGGGTTATDTGGAGGTTTTDPTGGGGTGGGPAQDPLDDELDFEAGEGTVQQVLADRGWSFTWRDPTKEPYPEFGPPDVFPYPDMDVTDGRLTFGLHQTFYWVDQKKGVLMYKKISGNFLVVADVFVEDHAQPLPGIPKILQAGAGIMVRDPASSAFPSSGQTWISIDRSGKEGVSHVHASWGRDVEDGSKGAMAAQGGKIAICRSGGNFQVWSRDGGFSWVPRTDLLDTLPGDFDLVGEVQVGLFVYVFNSDGTNDLPSPDGVKGKFEYVHQYDPAEGCDPALYGE